MRHFIRKETLQLSLWLICAAAGVLALWLAPEKTWAGAGALSAALALGLLFLLQKKTEVPGEDPELGELQESLNQYREKVGILTRALSNLLGEAEPVDEDWDDPEVLDRLRLALEEKAQAGAFLLEPEQPAADEVLNIALLKMNYLKLFILNTIEKTEAAADGMIEEFAGLIDLVGNTRRESDRSLQALGTGMGSGGFEELKQQSEKVISSFEDQAQSLQTFYKSMDTKFHRLSTAVESIEGNLNAIIDVSEQNNVIAINASIEASKLGQKGAGFKVLVGEILKSNERTRNFITQIGALIQQLREYNQEFVLLWNQEASKMVENIDNTKGFSKNVISSLTRSFGTVNEVLDRERSTSGETSRRLDKILTGLQFQDITRQQLENVIRHMVSIERHLEGFKTALESAGWKMKEDVPDLKAKVKAELLKEAKIHDERVILEGLDI